MDISNELIRRRRIFVGIWVLVFLVLFPLFFYLVYERAQVVGWSQALSSGRRRRRRGLLFLLIGWPLATITIVWEWFKLERRLKSIFETFPMLYGDLSGLNMADYQDEELQLFVYKRHLFYVNSWTIDYLNLDECEQLYTDFKRERSGKTYFIRAITYEGKERQFKFKKCDHYRLRLNDLYDYINSLYEEGE